MCRKIILNSKNINHLTTVIDLVFYSLVEKKNQERNDELKNELTSEDTEGMKPDNLSYSILLSPKTGNYNLKLTIGLCAYNVPSFS